MISFSKIDIGRLKYNSYNQPHQVSNKKKTEDLNLITQNDIKEIIFLSMNFTEEDIGKSKKNVNTLV